MSAAGPSSSSIRRYHSSRTRLSLPTSLCILLLACLAPQLSSALDAWHLDNTAILVNEQLDPIVNPNAQSSHMHKIMGGSAFGASYNHQTYQNSKCTSLQLTADRSNYWMPNLYARNPSNGKFISVPVNARFYYFLGRNSPTEPVTAFPEGLRILAGSPMSKTKTTQALFYCQINADFSNSIEGDNFNFNRDCPWGMKTEVFFPPCWDGINLYKADGSHIRYPIGSVNANSCPISHPVRLPAILLEYTWLVSQVMPNVPMNGNLFWANGDSTGYGIHADFVNGWDTSILSKALTSPGCAIGTDAAIGLPLISSPITECDVFKPYFQSLSDMNSCKPELGVLREPQGNDDMILLDALPGCNPVWGNTTSKPGCSTPAPQLDLRGLTGTDGPLVADASKQFQWPAPTTAGWKELMCVREIASIQGGVSYLDTKLTPQSCQTSCSKAGYTFAGVGQVGQGNWNCVCGNSIDPNAPYTPGMCTAACPGDSTQTCGAVYIFTVYQAGPGTNLTLPTTPDGSSVLGCYTLPSDKTQGLQAAATYTFTSSSMTRDLCIKACKEFGSKWAYTKSTDTCACGSNWNVAPGSFIPDSYCTLNCNGNQGQKCGDLYNAIVYNIANSDVPTQPANKPEGFSGCYNANNFINSNGFTYSIDQMSPSLCRRTCRSRGFGYAGLISGNNCYCATTAPASGDLLAPAVCNKACAGSAGETCGSEGTTAISVFDTTGAGALPPSGYPANYVGCTADGDPRTLSGYTFNSNSLTSTVCRDVCASYGYSVYGTEYSFQCFCGTSVGPRGLLPDSTCSAGCSGNSNERCGGPYLLSLYATDQSAAPPSGNPSSSPTPSAAPSPSASSTTSTSTATSSTASPSPSAAVPGCYTSSSRSIASVLITSTAMSPATCRLWCGVSGFSYSFMTNGDSCGCRNNLSTLTRVADSQCSSACTGAIKSFCGGPASTTGGSVIWSATTALGRSGICARGEGGLHDRRRLTAGAEDLE